MRTAIALVAVILFMGGADTYASCGRVIVHINGIGTKREEARQNMEKLRFSYTPTYAGPAIKYDFAYNGKQGTFDALAEVFLQKSVEDNPSEALATATYILSGDETALAGMEFADQLKFAYKKVITENAALPVVAVKIVTIMSKIQSYFRAGNNVIIVGHSQGALYANQAFMGITGGTAPNGRLKVLAVGTPADTVAGDKTNSAYVTANEDNIIDFIRIASLLAGWEVLPSNVKALAFYQFALDPFGHSFIDVYLNQRFAAWPKIRQNLDTMMTAFTQSEALSTSSCTEVPPPIVDMLGSWTGQLVDVAPTPYNGLSWSSPVAAPQAVSVDLVYAPGGFSGSIKTDTGLVAKISITLSYGYWFSSIDHATSWGAAIPTPVFGKIITGHPIVYPSEMTQAFTANPKTPAGLQSIGYAVEFVNNVSGVNGGMDFHDFKELQLSLHR